MTQLSERQPATTHPLPESAWDTPEWIAFSDYFEHRNGYRPHLGDDHVRELYCYYVAGAWDKESRRI
jgi:hypothetical protein